MGTVTPYDTANGRRYRVRYRKPDQRQSERRGFRTKREAELYLASVEVSKARGEFIDAVSARERVATLGSAWLSQQAHLKPSSLYVLKSTWRLWVEPRWGTTSVSDIRHSDVRAWVTELSEQRGATTVIRAYGILAAILDVAVRDRRIPANPARGVKMPRKRHRPHTYLSHEQVSDLALAAGDRGAIVLVLAYCGLRWGEASGLRVGDVDFERRRLHVRQNAVLVGTELIVGTPKTHKQRSVPFPRSLQPAIARACRGKRAEDLLFPGPDGDFLRRVHGPGKGWFWNAVVAAGLPALSLHDLRHTAASLAVRSGANVKAVQRMLGHASAAMTLDVYADLFDDDLDQVADRLDVELARTSVGKMWANVSLIGESEPSEPAVGQEKYRSGRQRRAWDSNPRGIAAYRFSRPGPSAARTALQSSEATAAALLGPPVTDVSVRSDSSVTGGPTSAAGRASIGPGGSTWGRIVGSR